MALGRPRSSGPRGSEPGTGEVAYGMVRHMISSIQPQGPTERHVGAPGNFSSGVRNRTPLDEFHSLPWSDKRKGVDPS